MSNANAYLSVVVSPYVSGVAGPDSSGVDVSESSARWCLAISIAAAVSPALLREVKCSGGATTAGPPKRSARVTLWLDNLRVSLLDRLPVVVGSNKLWSMSEGTSADMLAGFKDVLLSGSLRPG